MFDLQSLIKYLLEGLAVAVAAYLIPRKTVDYREIALIALTASAVFAVLDQFAPAVAIGARQGAGFGIGYSQVGMGYEGFQDLPILGYDVNGVPVTDPALGSTIVTPITDGTDMMAVNGTDMMMTNGTDMMAMSEGEVILGYDANGTPITDPALASTIVTPVEAIADPTQVGMGYEGYDDYEGYQDSTPGMGSNTGSNMGSNTGSNMGSNMGNNMGNNNENNMSGICKMSGDSCSYDPNVKTDQKARYVCHKDNGNCEPISACRETPNGECDWAENAQSASDLAGRKCKMETIEGQKQCRLSKPSMEGFDGGDISGFEGFSKVF